VVLKSSEIHELVRQGWSRNCPKCETELFYTKISGASSHKTQFYDATSNAILIVDRLPHHYSYNEIKSFLAKKSAEYNLNFKIWSNISCLSCGYIFPYDFTDLQERLNDNIAILMDGAVLIDKNKKHLISVTTNNRETEITNEALLAKILYLKERTATFGVRSYGLPIRPGTILKTKKGASVYVKCIRVRDFKPSERATKTVEELARYVVEQTDVNVTIGLDVEGDVHDFTELDIIYIEAKKP